MFRGSITALVTPFQNGSIDEKSLRGLIRRQIDNGSDAIVVAGSTGESVNLSMDELKQLIRIALEETFKASRKVSVIAGTGTNSTKTTIERTMCAETEGVHGCLIVTPYYNKPTQEGLTAHFSEAAAYTSCKIILYNVPGRTGLNMTAETVAELARIPNIVALKEAGGNLDQVSQLKSISDITILSGDDTLTLPMLAIGAEGVISVTSNVDPRRVASMCHAWADGKFIEARRLHYELFALSRIMFIETNPAPAKTALELMGLMSAELRLPLVGVRPENREKIRQSLISADLLEIGE